MKIRDLLKKADTRTLIPEPTPAEKAEQIIRQYTEAAGVVGVPGAFAPHVDTLALGPMWGLMAWRLARCHNVQLTVKGCLKIARATVGAALTFTLGVKTAGWFFSLSGVGLLPVAAMNVTLNGALTYAAGHAISRVFASTDGEIGPMIAAIIDEFKKLAPKLPSSPSRSFIPA